MPFLQFFILENIVVFFSFFKELKKKDFIYVFLESGEGWEKEGEKHQCVRETLVGCLSNAPSWGPGP